MESEPKQEESKKQEQRIVFWDSCVFIDRIGRTADKIEALEEITDAAEKKQVVIVTSLITLVEVLRLDPKDSTRKKDTQAKPTPS